MVIGIRLNGYNDQQMYKKSKKNIKLQQLTLKNRTRKKLNINTLQNKKNLSFHLLISTLLKKRIKKTDNTKKVNTAKGHHNKYNTYKPHSQRNKVP